MPSHKNQHFVPKCVLKPFSLNGEAKAINLYAFGKKQLIQNAPVKSQCAHDYMYGDDGSIEHGLSLIEGSYATALERVKNGKEAAVDLVELRFFAYLQLRRTQMAIQRLQSAENAFFADAYGPDAPAEPPLAYFMVSSLKLCFDTKHLMDDLKVRIVENNTDVDFVISDDPAIMTNKFHSQKMQIKDGFGVDSSGMILFMPLTPRHGVICYDGLVYTISSLTEGRVVLKKSDDVESLNELHYLKAASTIYFSSWETRDYVRDQFEKARNRRLDKWFVFKYAVFVGSDETGDIFKEATAEEAKKAERSIVHNYFKYPVPSRWLSLLSYRNPIKTFSNGTGLGHVRKKEWLNGVN